MRRRFLRLLLWSALSLGIFLIYALSPIGPRPPVASAHAFVIGSDPVDGSTVSAPPKVVRIFFNEAVGPASIAEVMAPDGHVVDASHSVVAAGNPRELDTPLVSPLALGSYFVRWTALANGNGQTTHGGIGFNIGQSSSGLPGVVILGPSTSNILPEFSLMGALSVAWEWLVFVALTFWVGILITEGFILERSGRGATLFERARKQTLPLQWLCLAALLVGEAITMLLRTTLLKQGLGGTGIDVSLLPQILFGTRYGYLWLLRMALVLVSMAVLWWTTQQQQRDSATVTKVLARPAASRFGQLRQQVAQEQRVTVELSPTNEGDLSESSQPPRLMQTAVWVLLAGLILLTYALTDDIPQLTSLHVSAVVFDWLYLAAQSIWLGSIAYLGYVLLPLLPVIERELRAELLASLARRMTPAFLTALAVLLVCALFLTEAGLGDVRLFLSDPYGRSLLVKFMLIALVLLLGIYTLGFLRPRLARQAAMLPVVGAELPARRMRRSALEHTERRLQTTLRAQAWLGAAILLCGALMNFFAPPIVFPAINYGTVTQGATPPAPVQTTQTQKAGDLTVSLQVLPARVDFDNTITITLTDGAGKAVTNAQVQLTINMELMDMGTAQQTINGGKPTYVARFDKAATFTMFGSWRVDVLIVRPGQAAVQTSFQVNLNP